MPTVETPERFAYMFWNTISVADSNAALGEYVVPESRNAPRNTLTREPHGLRGGARAALVIGGASDRLVPQAL